MGAGRRSIRQNGLHWPFQTARLSALLVSKTAVETAYGSKQEEPPSLERSP
jgi:hypothetical protein